MKMHVARLTLVNLELFADVLCSEVDYVSQTSHSCFQVIIASFISAHKHVRTYVPYIILNLSILHIPAVYHLDSYVNQLSYYCGLYITVFFQIMVKFLQAILATACHHFSGVRGNAGPTYVRTYMHCHAHQPRHVMLVGATTKPL